MTDVWVANTFPVHKHNSRTFHLKFVDHVFFGFSDVFPQINIGGDSARVPFLEDASRESRVALPPKGRLRHRVNGIIGSGGESMVMLSLRLA